MRTHERLHRLWVQLINGPHQMVGIRLDPDSYVDLLKDRDALMGNMSLTRHERKWRGLPITLDAAAASSPDKEAVLTSHPLPPGPREVTIVYHHEKNGRVCYLDDPENEEPWRS